MLQFIKDLIASKYIAVTLKVLRR